MRKASNIRSPQEVFGMETIRSSRKYELQAKDADASFARSLFVTEAPLFGSLDGPLELLTAIPFD